MNKKHYVNDILVGEEILANILGIQLYDFYNGKDLFMLKCKSSNQYKVILNCLIQIVLIQTQKM